MPVLKPDAEFGHCVPPETQYGITTYAPGWENAIKFREGDRATMARVVHIYPRFGPFGPVSKVSLVHPYDPCDEQYHSRPQMQITHHF